MKQDDLAAIVRAASAVGIAASEAGCLFFSSGETYRNTARDFEMVSRVINGLAAEHAAAAASASDPAAPDQVDELAGWG